MQRITGELADLAQTAMREAAAVIRNGKRACARASGQRQGQLRRALADLDTILERAARVITQTRSRLDGVMPESATRLVSLHDPTPARSATVASASRSSSGYGWNRTELTGIAGARTWCGHGVFAHNLVKIGALTQ